MRFRGGSLLILLDTHVLIWLRLDDHRLGRNTRKAISDNWSSDSVAVSAITFWEVGMQIQRGRISLSLDLDTWRLDLLEQGLTEIPVDGMVAARAGLLPYIHGDPADRLIVATALEGHELVTADRQILDWPGELNRLDARE